MILTKLTDMRLVLVRYNKGVVILALPFHFSGTLNSLLRPVPEDPASD